MHIPSTLLSLKKFRSFKRIGFFSALVFIIAAVLTIGVFIVQAANGTWTGTTSVAWLTPTNWSGSVIPGDKTTTTNTDIANIASGTTNASNIGINMNTQGGTEFMGAFSITGASTTGVQVSNSSTTVAGIFTLNGTAVNSVSNVIVRNASAATFTLANGTGSGTMNVGLGNATDNIINIDSTGGVTISSIISGSSKKLTLGGAGTGALTLSGGNTYSGDTTISSGKLALSGTGSIANSPNIVLAGGSTFDVSGLTTSLTLASGQGLKASGTTTTGTIATAAAKGLTTAANSPLQFTAFNGLNAPLTVAGAGTLSLQSGNPVTVNTTSALGAGAYTLIAKTGTATVVGSAPTSLTIGGSGLASGTAASLQITGGQLVLQVVSTTGKYRSRQSGNWNDFNTWQTDTGGGFVNAVSGQTPTSAADTIQIQSTHLVTVTASVDADQLTVDSGGQITVNNGVTFTIADGAGADLTDNGTVAAAGNITNNGQATINNTLQVEQGGFPGSGTGTYAYDQTSGVLVFNNTAGSFGVNNVNFWPTTGGPQNVNVKGAGGITMNVARTVGLLFQYAAGVSGAGNLTLNGTSQVNTGGFVSGSPIYGASSLLRYNTGGVYGRNGEWLPNATSGAGYPNNVQISSNTTLDLPNSSTTQPFQMAGSLTIDAGSTLTANGSSQLTQPLTILKDVNINGTLTLSVLTGADLNVGGNWTRAATGVFTPNGRAVTFNGSIDQTVTVTGGGVETFNYLLINKTGGDLVLNNAPATSVIVNAASGDVLQLLNTGGIKLNGQGMTLQNNGGTLLVSGGVFNRTITGPGTFAFTGSKTVTSAGGSKLSFVDNAGLNVNVLAGVNFGPVLTFLDGKMTLGSGGFVNSNAPTYAATSTLIYDCTCVFGRSAEWNSVAGPGYPANVQVNSGTDVNIGNVQPAVARQISGSLDAKSGGRFLMDHINFPMTATLTVLGNVLIETGGSLRLSSSSGGDLVTQGNFTNNGTFVTNNRAVFFTGGSTQTASDSSGTLTMPYVRINKSAGTVQLNSNLTTLGPGGGDSIQFTGATSTLTLNGRTLTLGSTIGSIAAGSGFTGSNTSGMSLQDGGSTGAMGTLVFTSGSELLQNLTMNRTGGSGSVALGSPLTVGGTLTLTNGIINTGSNTLTLGNAATSTGASGASYVSGNLKKIYSATGSFTFDVGDAGYSPVTIDATAGAGNVTAKATHAFQPRIGNTPHALQRYWTLTDNGITQANLTFQYLASDVPGTASEPLFQIFKIDGNTVATQPGVVNAVLHNASAPAVTSFSDWTLGEAIAPTAVRLINFNATSDNGLVRLDWNTGYEARNLGFNLYREQNGKRTRVTPSLLAGSALLTGPQSVLTAGHSYTWFDTPAQDRTGSVQYWLEDVDINGTRTLHGPVAPSIAKSPLRKIGQRQAEVLGQRQPIGAGTGLQIKGWPAASSAQGEVTAARLDGSGIAGAQQAIQLGRPGGAELEGSPAAGRGVAVPLPSPPYREPETAVFQRQIADMAGVKFNVSGKGWYRLAQPELIAAGLDPNANASHLQLFANGVEVPLRVSGNGQQLTASDVIEFYGAAADLPTDGTQTYYLVQGQSYGKRIMKFVDKDAPPMPPPGGAGSFAYTLERKERLTYFPGLDNGEADNFFGQIITNNSSSAVLETLNVRHPDTEAASGAQAQLEVSLQGVTAGSHTVRVLFNGADAGLINFAGTDHIAQAFSVPASSVREGDNVIQLASLGGDADISLADTVRLTYAHAYVADNNALALSVGSEETVRVKGFTNGSVRVLDITDPNNSQELTLVITAQPDGSFSADTQVIGATPDGPRTLLVFADTEAAHPDSVRNSNPSHWASEDAGADFLIISHRSLLGSVQPLADLRRSQGMAVDVIDVEDLYDEFSFGAHAPQAIQNFIRRAANSWKVTPRYVLLVGDATYDPRNYLGQGANDMIPTKLLWATDMKTASDDWMADMDGDGVPELAVGRLPVRTASEAGVLVGKIVNYVPGQSAQGALLVADHAGDNDFEGASSALGQQLPAGMPVQVVNRGTQDANTVRSQIIGNLNQGPQVVNYFGHGSVGLWTGAGLLTTSDAANLQNGNRLPLFTMMTCLNGYFQDVSGDSLAEALLKAQNGGAVAVWASSGQTDMEGQRQVAQPLYQLLFGGQSMTLGDAVRGAKSATGDVSVRRSWIFFGDPTQRIR
jgi:autotransporter-associated beta strand protein